MFFRRGTTNGSYPIIWYIKSQYRIDLYRTDWYALLNLTPPGHSAYLQGNNHPTGGK